MSLSPTAFAVAPTGRKGEVKRAIEDFDLALEIDPRQARVYVSRGLAYRDKGDLDQAVADFTKAIEIDLQYSEALVNRCVAYTDQGKADLAIADCTEAIGIERHRLCRLQRSRRRL